jgi:hypothetical protein
VTRFRISVFNERGSWFFRWDNVDVPTVCSVAGPFGTKEEAESEQSRFVEDEKSKRPLVFFESVDRSLEKPTNKPSRRSEKHECPICHQHLDEIVNDSDELEGLQCPNQGCGYYTSY